MVQYRTLRVSQNVQEILKTESTGIIHSVFNSSFNLLFGERLIHVGPIENGLAPFGIGLFKQDTIHLIKHLNQNDTVYLDLHTKNLNLAQNHTLILENSNIFNPFLHTKVVSQDVLLNNRSAMIRELIVRKWIGGLVDSEQEQETILQYLQQDHSEMADVNSRLIQEIIALESLVKNRADKQAKDIFDFWLGRGPGLTPSGDDMMTGICASLYLLEKSDHTEFISLLVSYLYTYGEKRTTPVAYEYLLYATKGEFHSTILNMCSALLQADQNNLEDALEEMEQIGHTSGVDTLLGILIGLKAGITFKS